MQEPIMINKHNDQPAMHYCPYLVAFFDILGQRDKMSRITLPPAGDEPSNDEKFKQNILQVYSNIMTFREYFADAIESFTKSDIENDKISEQAKSFFGKFREHPITYRNFADSVIVHIRLKGDEMKYAGRAMYGVLSAAAVTFNSCMSMGVPVRGGIDLGFAMNIGPDEIYGPALASAYHFESKVAAYPRVVVGNALVSYLKELYDSRPETDEEKVNCLLAKNSLALMTTDDDGNMIVDHLGDYIRNILQKMPHIADVVSKAYMFAYSEYEKYRNARNEAESVGNAEALKRYTLLAGRYELLKRYYEKHLPTWGLTKSKGDI